MPYTYDFPRPAVTVDIVLLDSSARSPQVLLVQRGQPPFEGQWALPGGFVNRGERLVEAAQRELEEETAVHVPQEHLRQLAAFGTPGRDPRGWTISIVFWARLPAGAHVEAGDDAADTRWWSLNALPQLAFDHADILLEAQCNVPGP
jgi:8-oxo-dGTP diphosphatase